MKRAAEKYLENPKKSVASIFTTRKGSFDWKIQQSLLFGCTCLSKFRTKTVKLACFDFDSTLVTTASKKKYPVSDTDFKPLNSSVFPKINSIVKTEYVIVVFRYCLHSDIHYIFHHHIAISQICSIPLQKEVAIKEKKSFSKVELKDFSH